ncbi:MAG: MarR family transcriptional regulator [Chloroflexota bacterium]
MVVITTNLHPLDDGSHALPRFAPIYEMAQTVDRFNDRLRALFQESKHKFTADQWHVLHTIAANSGLSQNELKDLVNKDKPTISRMIDVLERRGLVERTRSEIDRRRFQLALTAEGEAIYQQMQPKVVDFVNHFLSPISSEDRSHFYRILAQINAGLEES